MYLGPNTERFTYTGVYSLIQHYNPEIGTSIPFSRFLQKFWYYGCHCIMITKKARETRGVGKPVDEVDSTCKLYKEYFKNNDTVFFDFSKKLFLKTSIGMCSLRKNGVWPRMYP